MRRPFEATWTDDHFALLTKLVDGGHSAAQCSLEINRKYNTQYSRRAIIGKCHRHGLKLRGSNRPSPEQIAAKQQREAEKKAKYELKRKQREAALMGDGFTGAVGEFPEKGKCSFVIGSFDTIQACGQPADVNEKGHKTHYCALHQSIVFQKPATKANRELSAAGATKRRVNRCKTAINTAFV